MSGTTETIVAMFCTQVGHTLNC